MKENQVSLTAIMTAYIRSYHAMKDTPKIFNDFLAYDLIPEERRTLIEQGLSGALQPHLPSEHAASFRSLLQAMGLPNVISRSRYTEEYLEQAIKQEVQQYVILGAGMDTFAFRRPELLDKLRVFEVDHPGTQAFKRNRLAELGWEIPRHLQFVPIDFTKENLAEKLKESTYDPKLKSMFSWLGVTMYLSRDEVFAALRVLADTAPAGSMVIFDYFESVEASSPMREIREELNRIGEPIKTSFNPSMLASELSSLGLRLQENLSPADIQKRYFEGFTDGYHASEHVHLACAIVE